MLPLHLRSARGRRRSAAMDARLVPGHRRDPDSDQRRLRHGSDDPDHLRGRLYSLLVALGSSGSRRGAEPRDGRRGRHQHRKGRPLHIRARLRRRRRRRQRLHDDRFDRADLRAALYRRHVPGRRLRRGGEPARHHRLGLHDFAGPVDARILPVGLNGQGDHAARDRRHPHAAPARPVRAQGSQVKRDIETRHRNEAAMFDTPRFANRSELLGIAVLAVLLLVILPLSLDVFRLNLVAKYLTYSFVALGLVLCWGCGGILSLGQGVFFGLGGYCMAMFLKLEASSAANTKIQSTPGIPDFMDWNQLTELPFFWKPFHSLTFAIVAVLVIPAIFALIVGAAMFKRRVGGVYFAIITQAIAAILTILIVGQQGYTGGINGMTDLRTLLGWDIRPDHAKVVLYFFEVSCLFVCIFIAQFIRHSKL